MLHTNTRKLSKSRPCEPTEVVVHNQLSLPVEPTFPSDKYPVMTCPSAYCATSSGMDIEICRASTQPAFPSRVRTKYQSSVGMGLRGSGAAATASPPRSAARGRDKSTRLAGGAGAGGGGGGGSLPGLADLSNLDVFLVETLLFLTGGAAGGI